MTVEMIYYDWTPDSMLEVLLPEPDNWLEISTGIFRIVRSCLPMKVFSRVIASTKTF